jgi:hypothetical protein
MLLRVDRSYLESLLSHLAEEGFPASPVDDNGLQVLFPASPALFRAAAELDDWTARVGANVTVDERATS